MLKHYSNTYRENVAEELDDLKLIGIKAWEGAPRPSAWCTVAELKEMGIVGLYIEIPTRDKRNGAAIVNQAWSAYFAKNPEEY